MNIPTDDLAALIQRWWGSFSGRCVRRFLLMSGIDRCIVLSSQAFTSLIPLLILLSTWAPAGKGDVIARSLVNKFRVEGSAADSVEQLFTIPSGPSSSVSVASALLLVVSGASFARRIQKMYRAAWDRSAEGARSSVFAVVGLFVMLVEGALVYGIRALVRGLPYDWMWMFPVTVASGLVLWTSIPYLLLTRSVHWRRLLVTGGLSAVGTAVFGVVTAFYMPPLVTRYTNQFGLFGITIALIGWLLVASVIVVAAAAIGAEFDASRAPWAVRLQTRYHLLDPDLEPPVAVPDAAVGLDSSDLVLLLRVLVNWLILTVAVWVATSIVPGIDVPGGFLTLLGVSLLLGLVNAVLGPLLYLVAMPLTVLTLGTFALVVNGVLLSVTAALTDQLDTAGFGSSVLGALVISVVTTVLELVLRPLARAPVEEPPAS